MYDREPLINRLELLDLNFYREPSLVVAPSLVGCVIETTKDGITTLGRITEVEAYPGSDPSSHTYKREPTKRTEVQYNEGGRLYVYTIMGLHTMTSVVVNMENIADVVFIRSIEPISGIETMRARRNYYSEDLKGLASGPGMLSLALGITKNDNGSLIYSKSSQVRIYKDPSYKFKVESGKRTNLGVSRLTEQEAGETTDNKWRFFISGSIFLSK